MTVLWHIMFHVYILFYFSYSNRSTIQFDAFIFLFFKNTIDEFKIQVTFVWRRFTKHTIWNTDDVLTFWNETLYFCLDNFFSGIKCRATSVQLKMLSFAHYRYRHTNQIQRVTYSSWHWCASLRCIWHKTNCMSTFL